MARGKGSVNKVILIGRLGADPELKYTQTNVAFARLSLATSRVWKDDSGNQTEKTDWHRVIAWRKPAEIMAEYLKKGSLVCIEGRLETRSWDDPNGQKRYTTEIIVEEFTMLGGRRDERSGSSGTGFAPPEPEAPPAMSNNPPSNSSDSSDSTPDLGGEDDLPF